jgi:hypothetical protein
MNKSICSRCGSVHLQSVPAVYESHVWRSDSTTVGIDIHGDVGVAWTSGGGSTSLGDTLAPPMRPCYGDLDTLLKFGLLVVIAFFAYLSYSFYDYGYTHGFEGFVGTKAGAVNAAPAIDVVLIATAALLLYSTISRKLLEARLTKFYNALMYWRQLLYCSQCHTVMDGNDSFNHTYLRSIMNHKERT